MNGGPHLRGSLQEIYAVFAVGVPPVIEGCPCCTSERRNDVLLSKPLRQITGDELFNYVASVFLTLGSERDYRYLLPRILDVSASDPFSTGYPEVVLSTLGRANWRRWPTIEVRVLERFIHAPFDIAVANDLGVIRDGFPVQYAEGILCGAALAGMPIGDFLQNMKRPANVALLADWRARPPDELSAFWEDARAAQRELCRLLGS